MADRRFDLLGHFVRRELSLRYRGSITGPLWMLVTPLALLAIYGYVFIVIFQARVPEAETAGFLPFLALAFWPWMAFADCLTRSVTVMSDNASLISKTPVPHELLVFSSVLTNFGLHMVGYGAALLVLAAIGTPFHWHLLPLMIPFLLFTLMLATAVSLILSTLQVFIADVKHGLTAVVTLWFFATPVLYSPTLIPESVRHWQMLNPMAYVVTRIRDVMLDGLWQPIWLDVVAVLATSALFGFALWMFRRCCPRFEDFL